MIRSAPFPPPSLALRTATPHTTAWRITFTVCLALGIGANAALLNAAYALFLGAPPGIVDASRVVRVFTHDTRQPTAGAAEVADYPRFIQLAARARRFTAIAAVATEQTGLGQGINAAPVTVQLVTPAFFRLLGARPLRGRFFDEADEADQRPAAVLSHRLWTARFGADPGIIGRTVLLGTIDYAIVGIAPRGFAGDDWTPVDLWLPMRVAAVDFGRSLTCSGCRWLRTIARLQPGEPTSRAAFEATSILRSAEAGSDTAVVLFPLQSARGPRKAGSAGLAGELLAVGLLVFAVMCTSLTNLSVARAIHRARDVAIRQVLGASPWRIATESLREHAITAVPGFLGAVLVGMWSSSWLVRMLWDREDLRALSNVQLVPVTALLVVVVVLTTGLLPSVLTHSAVIRAAGLNVGGPARRASIARNTLVIAQVALTLVLISSAGLFLASIRAINGLPLGLDAERIACVRIELARGGYPLPEINRLYGDLRERVLPLSAVQSASLAVGTPFYSSVAVAFSAPGVDDSAFTSASGGPYFQAVTPEYFQTLGTTVRAGRTFTAADRSGAATVAIVNETMARVFWPRTGALGACLRIGTRLDAPCAEVVGVVEDVKRMFVTEPPTMQYYIPLAQMDMTIPMPVTALLVRTRRSAASAIPALQAATRTDATPYVSVVPMAQVYAWQLATWRIGTALLSLFGVVGMVLVLVGLYGLMSYMVDRRTRELGIRMALGASRSRIVARVVVQAASIAGVGVALGIAGSLLMARRLQALLFSVSATDAGVLAQAAALMLFVAAAATFGPAWRAGGVDPVIALRAE